VFWKSVFPRSIKFRLTVFTLAIFLLSSWLIVLLVSRVLQIDMQKILSSQQFSSASLIAEQVNEELTSRLEALGRYTTGRMDPGMVGDPAAMQTRLEGSPTLASLFNAGLFVTGLEGTAIASVPVSVGRVGVNYMERDSIAAALKEGKPTISRPVMGKLAHTPLITMAVPIRDTQGKVIGALVGVTDLGRPNFLDHVTRKQYGETGGYMFIAPKLRLIVTASKKSRIMETLPLPGVIPTMDRFLQGYEGSTVFVDRFGIESLTSVKRIPVADWFVAIDLPTKEAFAPIRALQQRLLLGTLLLTLVLGGAIWWMTFRAIRLELLPIFTATQRLDNMAIGQLAPQPLLITSQGEFGELFGAFNRLLAAKAQAEQTLRESEESYRRQFTDNTAIMLMIDPDNGRILEANTAAVTYYGYSREQLRALRIADINTLPPDRLQAALDSVGANQSERLVFQHRLADGSLRDVEVSASLIHLGNQTVLHSIIHDITERTQAEKGLLETNELLSIFVRQSPIYTYIKEVTPTESRILQASENFEQMIGIKGSDMVGKTMAEVFPADLAAKTLVDDLAVVAGGKTLEVEEELNGRSYNTLKFPIVQNGKTLVAGFTMDITERKRADELLLESEEKYRRLITNMPVGLLLQGPQSEILLSNHMALELLGLSEDELMGKTSMDPHWNVIHEDGSPFPGPTHPVPQAITTRQPVRDTVMGVLRPVTGDRIWLAVNAIPHLNADGQVRLVVCTFVDITKRKLAEDELLQTKMTLQAAMDHSPIGIAIADAKDASLIYVNEHGQHIMQGGEREARLKGINDLKSSDSWHLMDLDGRPLETLEVPLLRAVLLGEKNAREFMIRWEDGRARIIHAEAAPIRDAAGELMSAIVLFQDITERKQAEAEKAGLLAQLQQSQKMESLGTLAGGVAHDMNNVLGAILGLASAHIGSQPNGSPLHQALDTICKATVRGGKMVKSLLSFARQSPAESNKLDMNAILKEQVALLERTTLAKVHLEIDLEADLRPILGDASNLTHAFMNLCVNAVDAMPENGTLTLRTRNVDNDWIEVVVEDNGTGMPKEVLEKAMEPFYTTKETGKGTGLGLSMVFSTVKAHRGQMAIESEPGQGTRVRLRFPAYEQETPVQAAAPAAAEVTLPSRGPLKVLLVDDEELVQSAVQAILEVLGHTTVTTAQSGEEALATMAAGFAPDLVILDMNMPGLGGIGTLPRLRVLRPEVPVLLATGRVDQTALTLASAHPGVTLLSKPFGLRELQKHLESIGLG